MAARFNLEWMSKEEYKVGYYQKIQIIQKQDVNFVEKHFLYPTWENLL